ncbi:SDR family oxidoreductase [Solibacillus sp. FSL K6-4121]|uniref:SDR family oxidoreductase n=1 Tax=Solibacillus sp. FSL K6-4121 TaxID=2921505 RepID=UPI0030FC9533
MHKQLKRKKVLITGGSGVLGSEMARALAKQEMIVFILNRTAKKGEALVKEIHDAGGEAYQITADVLNMESLKEAKEQVMKQVDHLDILINAAGGNHPDAVTKDEYYDISNPENSLLGLTEEGIDKVFDLNFKGTLLPVQIFLPLLLKSECPSIINVSSMSAYTPLTKIPAYSAAKSALSNFTMWLMVHLSKTNIRVNAIAPGFFLTEQNRTLLKEETGELTARAEKIINATPMDRFGNPNELVGAILFLADNTYSSFINGIVIPIDGGFQAYSNV